MQSGLRLDERHDLADADHRSQRELDKLGCARGNPGEPQLYAELAAVARLAGSVHAAWNGTELRDGFDEARQQAGIGGSSDKEKGSDGVRALARRNAGGSGYGWHGRQILTRNRKKGEATARCPQATGGVIRLAISM